MRDYVDIMQDLQAKLLEAARRNPPPDTVPYAFEKRIMARLPRSAVPDGLASWTHVFTRAALSGGSVAILLAVTNLSLGTMVLEELDSGVVTSDSAPWTLGDEGGE